MSCYRFIQRRKAADPSFPVLVACQALGVSRSGFYDWRRRQQRPPTQRQRRQERLVQAVKRVHVASRGNYGSPRVHVDLVDQGWTLSENTVAKVMAEQGIQGRCGRVRRHNLTRQAKVQPDIPDLVHRDFTAAAPNRLYCTDITYVPTHEGWLYVAVIIDVFSRAIVGWAAAEHMRTSLVLDALRMAVHARKPPAGLIVHSDRGSQFTSHAWLDALAENGALPSMGRVGWCWDNALVEAWFAGFKNELVHPAGIFDSRKEARLEVYRYIRWHNQHRRHSALNYLAPYTWERVAATVALAA